MQQLEVLIMSMETGYRAAGNGFRAIDVPSLVGFRKVLGEYIHGLAVGSEVRIEFVLSPGLRSQFIDCSACSGRGRVSVEDVRAQYLADVGDAVDLTQRDTDLCQACEGLGVVIPGFRD
ncbi:MAG: hypothetical protein WC538_23855 [Thermoanaerobaculia bacterium]|jgi:hypothetical protein